MFQDTAAAEGEASLEVSQMVRAWSCGFLRSLNIFTFCLICSYHLQFAHQRFARVLFNFEGSKDGELRVIEVSIMVCGNYTITTLM